ncbi:hypothetical protein K3495_g12481 [Podosphaera aphanis]|nr:hypothetical protein K3495_g12481 [Podosphaera aphanis]
MQTVMDNNSGKDIEACLPILVEELRSTQMTLKRNLQDDSVLQNKLLPACLSHSACTIGCSMPAPSTNGLINNLRLSISNYNAINKSQEQSQFNLKAKASTEKNCEQYYTDRKYRSNLPLKEHNSSHIHHSKQHDQTKKCFICKKSGCWSSRHTEEERANAKMNYRNKFNKEADRHYHR